MSVIWPNHFDFRNDEVCQAIFKPFILDQMRALEAFDSLRTHGHTYIFHEHAYRVADDIKKTCIHMKLPEYVAENMYWAALPHDIGKMKLPPDIWDSDEKPSDELKALRRTHTFLGADIIHQTFANLNHPFKDIMLEIMLYHHEQMDGNGTQGIKGQDLSAPVRLAAIVEAFDGWRIARPHFGARDISDAGVLKRMREEKGAAFFDMELFERFAEMKNSEAKNIL